MTSIEQQVTEFFTGNSLVDQYAHEINEYVGTSTNYAEVYNCMTRLRFKIINKDLVDEAKLKKIPICKGIIWNGEELQFVIGSEVYKYKEAVTKDTEKRLTNFTVTSTKHLSVGKKIMQMFGGVMAQLIPVFVGVGMLQAIVGVLQWTKVMPAFDVTIGGIDAITNAQGIDIFWALLFAMSKSFGLFIGIGIAWSASKYFKLRGGVGIALGVILCSPILFVGGGALGLGGQWNLFTLAEVAPTGDTQLDMLLKRLLTINITPSNIKIFVVIFAIWIAAKMDDWLGKKINPLFELITRSTTVIFVVTLFTLGIVTPIWNFIEALFGIIMFYVAKAPLGIGIGIFAGIWQGAVVFGVHIALGIVGFIQIIASAGSGMGGYGIFTPASDVAVWGQLGALIAVAIMTKNSATRRQAWGMVPLGLFGVTEPILYGINLPKKRPLYAGMLSSFIAGCFIGAMGVTGRIGTGMGIFSAIGYFNLPIYDPTGAAGDANGEISQTLNGLYYIIAMAMNLGLGILFGCLMYNERPSEKSSLSFNNRQLLKLIKTSQKANHWTMSENEMKEIKSKLTLITNSLTPDEIKKIKEIEKSVQKEIHLKNKLQVIEEKENKKTQKLFAQGKKLVEKKKLKRAEIVMKKYQAVNNETEKARLMKEIENLEKQIDFNYLDKLIKTKMKIITPVVEVMAKKYRFNQDLDLILNNYYNGLNIMKVVYGLDSKKAEFDWKETKNEKNTK